VTKWTPPLSIAELARTASHLACGAKHIEATWSEIDAVLPRREPARLDNLRIPAVNAGQVVPGTDYQESVTEPDAADIRRQYRTGAGWMTPS
jgi:hypothetical protein